MVYESYESGTRLVAAQRERCAILQPSAVRSSQQQSVLDSEEAYKATRASWWTIALALRASSTRNGLLKWKPSKTGVQRSWSSCAIPITVLTQIAVTN
jgi:hypothetical protein